MRHVLRTKLRSVDVVEGLNERADFQTRDHSLFLTCDAADEQLETNRTWSACRVDFGRCAKIGLMIIDKARIDFYESSLLIRAQADGAVGIASVVILHFRDQSDRPILSSQTFAGRLDRQRTQPACESGAPCGWCDEIVREMHDSLRSVARPDRGVIPHCDELAVAADENHFVEETRCEAEAQRECLTPLHFIARAEGRPELCVARLEERIIECADAIELEGRQVESGRTQVAGSEVRWEKSERRRHRGNIQHPTSNIQHPMFRARRRSEGILAGE